MKRLFADGDELYFTDYSPLAGVGVVLSEFEYTVQHEIKHCIVVLLNGDFHYYHCDNIRIVECTNNDYRPSDGYHWEMLGGSNLPERVHVRFKNDDLHKRRTIESEQSQS